MKMIRAAIHRLTLAGLALTLLFGTACAPGATSFVRDDVDFSYIRRVTIYPFANLSQDVHASQRMHSVFTAELLAQDAVVIIDQGEILNAMAELRLSPGSQLSAVQIMDLGQALSVDGIFFGTIEEYGVERISDGRTYSITASFKLVETETGSMIWNSQTRADGTSFWRKLFGGGSASLYGVSRSAVQQALGTLF